MSHIFLDKSSVYKSISFSFKRIYKCILPLPSLTLIRQVCSSTYFTLLYQVLTGGLISEKSHFGWNLQKWMPNPSPEHFLFRKIVVKIVFESIFGDVSQSERLSEIKSPLFYCLITIHRAVVSGSARGALAPPEFGSSVNPIPTRGGRLCPPHYW